MSPSLTLNQSVHGIIETIQREEQSVKMHPGGILIYVTT